MNIFQPSASDVCLSNTGEREHQSHSHASGGFPHVCHVSLSCGHYQAVHSTCVQSWLKKDSYVEQRLQKGRPRVCATHIL